MDEAATKPLAKQAAKAAKAAEELAESGRSVEKSSKKVSVGAQRQVQLAADRTLLASERTYAAWVRTALTSLASGVGARALLENHIPLILAKLTGSVLVLFAGFCMVAAVWRQFMRPVPPPPTDLRPIPRFALVPINAFLLLVALAALIGIWAS